MGSSEKCCTALYGSEAWSMKSAERRKVNDLEIKCFRRLVGVSRMDTPTTIWMEKALSGTSESWNRKRVSE